MIENSVNNRIVKLHSLLKQKDFLRVIETVNGLEALIIENTELPDENGNAKGFDALWLSGFCHAAFKGMPDNESVDISEKISAIKEIFAVTDKPLIIDLDTGGNAEKLCNNIQELVKIGVSAAVIEDKKGVKRNSLYGNDKIQQMEDIKVFADKIRCVKEKTLADDFMIFARIESFIAGESIDVAIERAEKYIESGADAIVIHSISQEADDIFAFAEIYKKRFADIPLVFIPTAYNSFTDTELYKKGADIIIYANQLMRSAYRAMQETALSILKEGRSFYADKQYCATARTILNHIDGE